uniref:Uncharacterized protein n=1 Tax=Globisporangium ultimum (strain ATCC 200006 / CBS 805.95 / DAOM BR144) TaxID=431595 RepID=K3WBG3_GLOUD
MFSVLMAELSMRLDVLSDAISHLKLRMNAQQNQLQQFEREKEKLRIEKHEQKQREEECRRAEIRQKTVERTSKFKVKKKATNMLGSHHKSEALSSENISKLEGLVFKGVTPLVESTIGPISQQRRTHFEELGEKRCRVNLLKELTREEHARAALDAARELERRRHENVQMKREDGLASALERLVRRKQRLKSLKLRLERIASTPFFSCIQLLSGKKWRITMYEQRARGYMLDGLRIVAYDPTSSASYSSHMTTREYTSLGYGRTREGLSTFCKWFCLLYEKRKRHFRLIWSGPPCPPPLRVREYDSVVCIHKEGVKLSAGRKSAGYALISVFVRPNARTRLHFVMSSLKTATSSSMEKVVYAPMLIHDGALQLCYGDHDDSYVVWKHESGHQRVSPNQNRTSEIRVYSGEMRIQTHSVLVHVFDVSSTEYALELHPLSPSTLPPELLSMYITHKRTTLLKHEVNPYDVRLPFSAFGDLLAAITFSAPLDCHAGIPDSDSASSAGWKPMVSHKWIDTMAKVDRKHFLVTLSVVQQKTEFRSYLLLELTCLSGSSMRKQPLRVSLSSYLRCGNVMSRIFPFDTEGDEGCHVCGDDVLSGCGGSTTCASCNEIQVARLASLRNLIVNRQLVAEAMPIDYHGYCRLCGTLAKPIMLIVRLLTAAGAEVLELLGYHFSCFDLANLHSANGSALAADLRQAIDVERIVVGE